MIKHVSDEHQDIRDAVRALCAEFPDSYHREVDEKREIIVGVNDYNDGAEQR